MAKYLGTFFLSNLPFCQEKMEMINGKEQMCLVIPCDEAQLFRWGRGGWAVRLYIKEMPPNPQLKTHRISIAYRDMGEAKKYIGSVIDKKALNLGHLYAYSEHKDLKKDRTNNMTKINCDGRLFLDSIQREDIKVDPTTGRKYLNVSFRDMERLDTFCNSHELIVKTANGEYQIGVATENAREDKTEEDIKNKEDHPESYNGFAW